MTTPLNWRAATVAEEFDCPPELDAVPSVGLSTRSLLDRERQAFKRHVEAIELGEGDRRWHAHAASEAIHNARRIVAVAYDNLERHQHARQPEAQPGWIDRFLRLVRFGAPQVATIIDDIDEPDPSDEMPVLKPGAWTHAFRIGYDGDCVTFEPNDEFHQPGWPIGTCPVCGAEDVAIVGPVETCGSSDPDADDGCGWELEACETCARDTRAMRRQFVRHVIECEWHGGPAMNICTVDQDDAALTFKIGAVDEDGEFTIIKPVRASIAIGTNGAMVVRVPKTAFNLASTAVSEDFVGVARALNDRGFGVLRSDCGEDGE